ncbi:MAG: hypothetical protein RSE18_13620, partial [Acinetobacter sp.]
MKIESLAINVIDVAKTGYDIYVAVAKHMDAMEIESGLSGIAKKGIVLDYIHKTIKEVATNWSYWFGLLSKFIDSIKTIYNIVK